MTLNNAQEPQTLKENNNKNNYVKIIIHLTNDLIKDSLLRRNRHFQYI